MTVSVEGSRSAEPLTRCGSLEAAHWITWLDALRVAMSPSSGEKRGGSESHPSGMRPSIASESSSHWPGYSER